MFAFCIGASLMVAGGLVESVIGVKAERGSLVSIAAPSARSARLKRADVPLAS